jgi:predicted Co/Zn/Cd cation transporter (cation efflux family)
MDQNPYRSPRDVEQTTKPTRRGIGVFAVLASVALATAASAALNGFLLVSSLHGDGGRHFSPIQSLMVAVVSLVACILSVAAIRRKGR